MRQRKPDLLATPCNHGYTQSMSGFLVFARSLLICLLLSRAAFAAETAPTIIRDQAEARRLVGKHDFSEAIMSFAFNSQNPTLFGQAIVTIDDTGVFRISGEQRRHQTAYRDDNWATDERLTIRGIITRIETGLFKFSGQITYDTFHDYDGPDKHCLMNGTVTFRHFEDENTPQFTPYWQLQESTEVCQPDKPGEAYLVILSVSTSS